MFVATYVYACRLIVLTPTVRSFLYFANSTNTLEAQEELRCINMFIGDIMPDLNMFSSAKYIHIQKIHHQDHQKKSIYPQTHPQQQFESSHITHLTSHHTSDTR